MIRKIFFRIISATFSQEGNHPRVHWNKFPGKQYVIAAFLGYMKERARSWDAFEKGFLDLPKLLLIFC
jgi:hypothetical protein